MDPKRRIPSAARTAGTSEGGWAMLAVLGLAVVIFLFLTTAIMLAQYEAVSTGRQTRETKSMHLADGGINQYLYNIRQNPYYWQTNPTMGPTATEDGTWTVTAQAPTQTSPLTLVAVATSGQVASRTTTITATVRYPTFADYSFMSNAGIDIGATADIFGKVRSNQYVDNAGTCWDEVIAAGDVRGAGTFKKGYKEYQPSVDFGTVTTDLNTIKQTAIADNTYFAPTANPGYYLRVGSGSFTAYYVTGGETTGNLTLTLIGAFPLPARGGVYVDDNVWVDGTLAGRLTIATPEVLRIKDNINYANNQSALGLIAQRNIAVMYWYPGSPENLTVKAALLSQTADISAAFKSGYWRNSFTFVGSMSYATHSGFYSGGVGGYNSRSYTYDANLDVMPPPLFPVIRDGSLKVTTWLTRS